MIYRPGPGWGQGLAVALLAAAAGVCVAALATRDAEPPWAAALRNERPHACDDPGCGHCESLRDWMRRNPGRHPGDILDAAESGAPVSLPTAYAGPPPID